MAQRLLEFAQVAPSPQIPNPKSQIPNPTEAGHQRRVGVAVYTAVARSQVGASMRPRYLALVVLALPLAARAQTALEQAFRDWARDHVHPVASVPESPDDADLRSLSAP